MVRYPRVFEARSVAVNQQQDSKNTAGLSRDRRDTGRWSYGYGGLLLPAVG
jgi:hypothetical protein